MRSRSLYTYTRRLSTYPYPHNFRSPAPTTTEPFRRLSRNARASYQFLSTTVSNYIRVVRSFEVSSDFEGELRLERPLARCLNNRPCSLERGSSFEFFNFCSRNILEYFFGNECVISRVFQGKRKLAYVGTGEENAKINRAAFASFYCGSAEFAARST